MKNKHIHEILISIQKENKIFENREEFVSYVNETFGEDCIFSACSAENMNANDAYDFLIKKEKIAINDKNKVSLHPNMQMCDGHHKH